MISLKFRNNPELSIWHRHFVNEEALMLCYLAETLSGECGCWVLNLDVYDYNTRVLSSCAEVLLLRILSYPRLQSIYWREERIDLASLLECQDQQPIKLPQASSDIFYSSLQCTFILPDSVLGIVNGTVMKTDKSCPHRDRSLVRGDSP